ncbi:hypothetical protein AGMMS49543_18030 [Betaproteobacteria bacterium]|nr:hypothetical protein AGMMS49543_18030 [Betaproteobacteria bacterium]GHU15740.1 hypothetical protein AGMMS50243_00020 [Betaproteobacteria bacterium]
MPQIPNLENKLNTLRSRQIPVWMYFQSAEQIEWQYGRGAIDVFFGSADLKLFFRLDDDKTRKLVSSLVGTTEKMIYTNSRNGRQNTRTSRKERVNVIEPHQLGELKDHEVVCLFGGASAIGKATPFFKEKQK